MADHDHFTKIPEELMIETFAYLSRKDILSVFQTHRSFLGAARKNLYRTVELPIVLPDVEPGHEWTLFHRSISDNPSLAGLVRYLHVKCWWDEQDEHRDQKPDVPSIIALLTGLWGINIRYIGRGEEEDDEEEEEDKNEEDHEEVDENEEDHEEEDENEEDHEEDEEEGEEAEEEDPEDLTYEENWEEEFGPGVDMSFVEQLWSMIGNVVLSSPRRHAMLENGGMMRVPQIAKATVKNGSWALFEKVIGIPGVESFTMSLHSRKSRGHMGSWNFQFPVSGLKVLDIQTPILCDEDLPKVLRSTPLLERLSACLEVYGKPVGSTLATALRPVQSTIKELVLYTRRNKDCWDPTDATNAADFRAFRQLRKLAIQEIFFLNQHRHIPWWRFLRHETGLYAVLPPSLEELTVEFAGNSRGETFTELVVDAVNNPTFESESVDLMRVRLNRGLYRQTAINDKADLPWLTELVRNQNVLPGLKSVKLLEEESPAKGNMERWVLPAHIQDDFDAAGIQIKTHLRRYTQSFLANVALEAKLDPDNLDLEL